MKSRKTWITAAIAIAVVIVCVMYFTHAETKLESKPQELPVSKLTAEKVSNVRPQHVRPELKLAAAEPTKDEPAPQNDVRDRIPDPGTNAKHKVWVKGKYGPGESEFGKKPGGGGEESMPPQGFAFTKDGNLVVLDTFKNRLVYYDKEGQIEKTKSLEENKFIRPVDVEIARDGTVAVLDDDAGEQPKGLVLFDSSGNVKAELPNIKPVAETNGLYTVGNDFYLDNQHLGSRNVADSSGKVSNESPDLYTQAENGMVPGRIAPDGVTVVSAGINNRDTGEFFVTVIRGKRPDHIFTRFYLVPPQLLGLPFAAADGQGRLYVVLFYTGKLFLACLNENGDPVGQVQMPMQSGDDPGRPFRQFRVVESGGLVYQVMSDNGASYEWFDCH